MYRINRYLFSPISIRVLTIALNFISNILINRSLGLELKGQYTTILNYANFLQMFLNLGICYAYPLLRKERGEDKAKEIILTLIWGQTFLFILISGISILINPQVKLIMIVVLSTAMICNSQINFISLIDDIKKRNLFLLSSTFLFIILNTLAIMFASGNIFVIVVLTTVKSIYEIFICAKSNKYFVFKPSILKKDIFAAVLKIGIPTAILGILISCNYNIDIFMLNWMNSGDVEIGIYGVAYSLTNMLWILPDAFKEIIYNKSARENDYRFVIKCITINMIFCICVCIGFSILGKWFLNIVYGSQYVVAFKVTMTLFCGIIPMVAFKLIHPIYVNNGKSNVVVIMLCVAVLANIASSWILIPNYGSFGAAIASVISYTVCGTLFFIKYYLDFGDKLARGK